METSKKWISTSVNLKPEVFIMSDHYLNLTYFSSLILRHSTRASQATNISINSANKFIIRYELSGVIPSPALKMHHLKRWKQTHACRISFNRSLHTSKWQWSLINHLQGSCEDYPSQFTFDLSTIVSHLLAVKLTLFWSIFITLDEDLLIEVQSSWNPLLWFFYRSYQRFYLFLLI